MRMYECSFTLWRKAQLLVCWTLRVLRKVYITQNHGPSIDLQRSRNCNVSETGCVSVFRWGKGNIYSAGSVRRSYPQSFDHLAHTTFSVDCAHNNYFKQSVKIFLSLRNDRPPLWCSGESSWLQNGDVLCFLWSTNWIYIHYVEESRPPLWSSGQSSCRTEMYCVSCEVRTEFIYVM
jgi:hypothetical protein